MGFTFDMGSGEILDETSTQTLEECKSEAALPDNISDIGYLERLEPVTESIEVVQIIPESIAQADIDIFLDKNC